MKSQNKEKFVFKYTNKDYNNTTNLEFLKNNFILCEKESEAILINLTISAKTHTLLVYFIYPFILIVISGLLFWLNSNFPYANITSIFMLSILFVLDIIRETLTTRINSRILNEIIENQINNKIKFVESRDSKNNSNKINNTTTSKIGYFVRVSFFCRIYAEIINEQRSNNYTIYPSNKDNKEIIVNQENLLGINTNYTTKQKSQNKIKEELSESPTIIKSIYLTQISTYSYDNNDPNSKAHTEYQVEKDLFKYLNEVEKEILFELNGMFTNYTKLNKCRVSLTVIIAFSVFSILLSGVLITIRIVFHKSTITYDTESSMIIFSCFLFIYMYLSYILYFLKSYYSKFKEEYEETLRKNYSENGYYLSFNSGKNIYLHKITNKCSVANFISKETNFNNINSSSEMTFNNNCSLNGINNIPNSLKTTEVNNDLQYPNLSFKKIDTSTSLIHKYNFANNNHKDSRINLIKTDVRALSHFNPIGNTDNFNNKNDTNDTNNLHLSIDIDKAGVYIFKLEEYHLCK